jgi:hypothetical protein
MRRSVLLSIVLLAALACDSEDDGGGESGGATSNATSADTGGATAASDGTAGGGACGWGPTGDEMVPEGYVCGGDGEDPSGMVAMACPEDVTLEVGGECGGVAGTGCCDATGDAWFCGQTEAGPVLARLGC